MRKILLRRRIRGGRGLGDSIYLRPIVEHFLKLGDDVTVLSDYAGVFAGLNVQIESFSRHGVNVLAHYTLGKGRVGTNQWEDICESARVNVPLHIEWKVINNKLVEYLHRKAAGRPILLVHGGRVPMGRTDGFGAELLPDARAFSLMTNSVNGSFRVRIGSSSASPSGHPALQALPPIYPIPFDFDLSEKTTVTDLLDIASVCSGIIGQCSFVIPLAEVFDKPLLIVWAARGLNSSVAFIKQITPEKVLSKPTSRYVVDDWPEAKLQEEANAFCHF